MATVSGCQNCAKCPARHRGICSALPNGDELTAFRSVATRKSFKRGKRIFEEGAAASFYAVISSGMVKLTKQQHNDCEQIVGVRFATDFVGRAFARQHVCSAKAATNAELCLFPREAFLGWVNQRSELRRELLRAAFSELDECREWTTVMRQRSSYQRVASFLHLITRRTQGTGIPPTPANLDNTRRPGFRLPMARKEIAGFLGLTKESVSRQMTLLKRRAVIDLVSCQEVIVRDVQKLAMEWPAFQRG